MANVTIQGASYEDVPSIILPKTGGGTEEFFWGDAELGWLGNGVEDLGEIYSADYTLDETLFNGWTPSTTAKAIIATQTLSDKVSVNFTDYEYALRWKVVADLAYDGSETNKARCIRSVCDWWQLCFKRANSLANIQADNLAGNACVSLTTAGILEYYNASGSHTYTWTVSYGVYPALNAATFASSTANSTTMTIKTPTINARCNTSYQTTANMGHVDQANSPIKVRGHLYRYKKQGILTNIYSNICKLYGE